MSNLLGKNVTTYDNHKGIVIKQYKPTGRNKEVSRNTKDLQELADNSNFLGKLVFNQNESIESLMFILSELYRLEE